MKIHFIIFYKNDNCIQKCLSCIESLIIPENVEFDVLGVNEGDSICEAYNFAMKESDADIKIYLRENVYITNPKFVDYLLDYFNKNQEIKVAGLVGGNAAGEFVEWVKGNINICNDDRTTAFKSKNDTQCVDYIHGMLIATKIDAAWGDDDTRFDLTFCDNVRRMGEKLDVMNCNDEALCLWEFGLGKNERFDVFLDNNTAWCFNGEKPLVSVLMTSYNSEGHISDSIESVLNQTYKNIELIIADAASTDDTQEIIMEYAKKDSRVIPVFLKTNNHACCSSNVGRKLAKGKYLALIGHDDWWQVGKIEEQVTFLEHQKDVDVCFTTAHILGDGGKINDNNPYYSFFKQANKSSNEWLYDLYLGGNKLCAASAMLRMEKTPERLYRLDTIQLQDYELWMYMLMKGEIYILQEDLTYYRQFENEKENLSSIDDNSPKRIRLSNEMGNIHYRVLMDMPDDIFRDSLNEIFMRKDSLSHEELMCERAFLLYRMNTRNFMNVFCDILQDEKYVELLNNKYCFTLLDYYEMECKIML